METRFDYCPRCGKRAPEIDDLNFCPHCGSSLSAAGPESYPLPTQKISRRTSDQGLSLGSVLLLSLFVGFMMGTAGLAIYPPFGKVAGPLVCGAPLRLESNRYNPSPGSHVVTRHFYCPDGREVTFRIAFASAGLYSLICFIPLASFVLISRAIKKTG